MEHQQKLERSAQPRLINLANKYMNSNGLAAHGHGGGGGGAHDDRQPYSNPSSPADSDKQHANSGDDIDSPKHHNGDREHSPIRSGSADLSPRMWKLHYESKTVNRERRQSKPDESNKSIEELAAWTWTSVTIAASTWSERNWR